MGFMVSGIIFKGFYNINFTVIAKYKVYRFIFLYAFTVGLYITACGNDNGIRVHLLCLVKHLAGLAVGFWKDKDDIRSNWSLERTFAPVMEPKDRDRRLKGWKKAVRAALYFANDEEE